MSGGLFAFAQSRGGRWEYGTFSLYGTEILLWSVFLLTFGVYLQSQKSNLKLGIKNYLKDIGLKIKNLISNIQYSILFFFIFSLLSIFWSIDKQLATYYVFHIIEVAILIYLIHSANLKYVSKVNFDYKKIFYAIFISSFIQACLGIWQFINQRIGANKWFGMAERLPSELGVSVVFTGLRRWLRAYGGFSHPNVLAGFLVFGFLIGLYLIINRQVENKRRFCGKLILIFANLIILIGLLFTFSRGAWVSLFIVILLYCYFVRHQRQCIDVSFSVWRNLKLFLIYSLLLTVVIVFIFREPFLTRIKSVQRLEKRSIEERLNYYQESWQLVKKHPIFGVGIGNYTLAVHNLIDSDRKIWEYQPAHNIYVLILVELGMVGFILFVVLLYKLLQAASRKQQADSIVYYLLFAVLLLMLFDHYLWTSYFGVMLFGLTIGLVLENRKSKYRHTK